MAEWLKAAVLKTVNGVTRSGVRIPLPPPENKRVNAPRIDSDALLYQSFVQIWCNPISLTSLFGPLPDCFFIASETFIDQFSCLFVVTGQHVSVRVQSNRSIRVSQSLLNGFERDALSQPM